MTSHNLSDTLRRQPPTVKLEIGVNGYTMVLRFSTGELAQQYFKSVNRNGALNPQRSNDALGVSLDLRKARKIVLGKSLGGPFKIQFRTCWSAQKWHQLSSLSPLSSRKGRCVLITQSATPLAGSWPTGFINNQTPHAGYVPTEFTHSPPAIVDILIQRAESLLIRKKSSDQPRKSTEGLHTLNVVELG